MDDSKNFLKFFIEMMVDIPEMHLSHFQDLLDILLSIFSGRIKDNSAKFGNERLYYLNLLSQKILAHGFSIKSLTNGITLESSINNFSTKMFDPFSIYSIERTLIENYLVQNYLSNSSENEDTLDCRFAIWMRYGINKRNISPESDEEKRVVELDNKAIENFENQIKSKECYKNLSQEKKESFLKTINKEWKILFFEDKFKPLSWNELIKEAGIKEGINDKIYNFLSWHAHSQSISILQFKEMWDTHSEQEALIKSIKKVNMFIAFLIADIILSDNDFKNTYYSLSEEHKNMVNYYNFSFRSDLYMIKS